MTKENSTLETLSSENESLKAQLRKLEDRISSIEAGRDLEGTKLLNIINGSNLGTWEWNIKTGKTIFNERWAEMIGYTLSELQPITISTWVEFTHPEDYEKAAAALERHFQGATLFYDVELRLRHKEGYWIWVNDRGKVMEWDQEGSPIWMFGTHTDITQRVEMESQLKHLLDHEIDARDIAIKERDNQATLTNMLFDQPMTGVFFMMLDEPIYWNDQQDKEALLDYAFEHHRITRVNQTMLDQYRAKEEDLIGATPKDMFSHDLEHGRDVWRKFFDEGHLHIETNEQRMDGSSMSVLGDYICIYDEVGRIVGHFGVQTDVTDKLQAVENEKIYREALDDSENRYRTIVENIGDVIWIINLKEMKLTYMSPSFEQLSGFSVNEIMQSPLEHMFIAEKLDPGLAELLKNPVHIPNLHEFNQPVYWQVQGRRKDGTLIWIENSYKLRYKEGDEFEIVGVTRDITERKRKEEEVLYLSMHDQQTGLLNREAIKKMSFDADQEGKCLDHLSVIYIDIDHFKLINDAIGHEGGDRLIAELAEKIQKTIGSSGSLYRYASDEFIILTESCDVEALKALSVKIQKVLSRQISIESRLLFVTASIGICGAEAGVSVKETIRRAEKALYAAKKENNAVVVYHDALDPGHVRDFILETDLSKALEDGQFELYYQPIFDVRSGEFNQAEALLRWNHPEFGRVSPAEFIPIAERTKLIIPMTDWVIEQACQRISEWAAFGFGRMVVSVNISLLAIENRGDVLVDFIRNAIEKSGIEASSLKLEITESTLINDLEEIIRIFKALKMFGVKLALDDFGTGYSTFGTLIDLPLDIIKLDRALIRNLENSEQSQMIVSSMITIIHGLELEVVVEGVETHEQFQYLKVLNSDYIQGFLFSQPLPESEFVKYYFNAKAMESVAFPVFRHTQSEHGYIEWDEDWTSGHLEIDRQHFSMMQLANQILRYVVHGKQKKEILTQVNILIDYVKAHFDYEEELNEIAAVSDRFEHAEGHAHLLKRVCDLKSAYEEDQIKPSAFFTFIVDDFILGHMIEEDHPHYEVYKEVYEKRCREALSMADELRP